MFTVFIVYNVPCVSIFFRLTQSYILIRFEQNFSGLSVHSLQYNRMYTVHRVNAWITCQYVECNRGSLQRIKSVFLFCFLLVQTDFLHKIRL